MVTLHLAHYDDKEDIIVFRNTNPLFYQNKYNQTTDKYGNNNKNQTK